MKQRRRYILLGAALSLLVIYYLVMSLVAVNHRVNQFNNDYHETPELKGLDTINVGAIPGYNDLISARAFLNAQLKIAGSDSIGLLVSLRDSTLQLLIRGVPVHSTTIARYEKSGFFSSVDPQALITLLSMPLRVTGMRATFRKEPVTVRIAPRDTSQVVADVTPDTTAAYPAYFSLMTDAGIRLWLGQQEAGGGGHRIAKFMFGLKERVRSNSSAIKATATFRIPPYSPEIRLWLPASDVRVVYRALPREAMVALKL